MSEDKPDLDAWLDAMSGVAKLPVDEAYREGVKANLEVAARMAAIIDAVPLDDSAEPAPVYRA